MPRTLIKSAVLNLSNELLKPHVTELLDLGPKFVPTPQTIPYMDIITSTELIATNLDKAAKHHASESIRQEVSNTLSKFINKKIPSNLSKSQRQALKELRAQKDTQIFPFDKGAGFAVLNKEDALVKMSEELGEAKIIDNDPTKTLLTKFQ